MILKKFNINLILFGCYFATMSVQQLLTLPIVGEKLQLSEAVFMLILLHALTSKWIFDYLKINVLDIVAFLYPVVALVNYLVTGINAVLLELLGAVYLFFVYYLTSRFLISARWLATGIVSTYMKAIITVSALLALTGLIVYLVSGSSVLIWPFQNYPYFGDVIRVQGFARTPNMLMSITAISVLILLGTKDWKRTRLWMIMGVLVCIATMSKSLLVFFAVFIMWIVFTSRSFGRYFKSILVSATGVITIGLFVAVTLFVSTLSDRGESNPPQNRLIGTEEIIAIGNLNVYGTFYYYLKRVMVRKLPENWLGGTGLGQFRYHLTSYKSEGEYPKNFLNYDPHDSYLGLVTETGLPGLIFLILFAFVIVTSCIKSEPNANDKLKFAAGLAILYMAIEATCIDAWNFRQYWIVLAILQAGLLSKNKSLGRLDVMNTLS